MGSNDGLLGSHQEDRGIKVPMYLTTDETLAVKYIFTFSNLSTGTNVSRVLSRPGALEPLDIVDIRMSHEAQGLDDFRTYLSSKSSSFDILLLERWLRICYYASDYVTLYGIVSSKLDAKCGYRSAYPKAKRISDRPCCLCLSHTHAHTHTHHCLRHPASHSRFHSRLWGLWSLRRSKNLSSSWLVTTVVLGRCGS
jgi:hypothetical protein